jgi:hypothetical protein
MEDTVLVWTAVMFETLVPVAAVPVPEPPAVQYANATPPLTSTSTAVMMTIFDFFENLAMK